MIARAILAFLALPGVVAMLIPVALAWGRRPSIDVPAVGTLALGLLVVLGCARAFVVEGRGTLAPWAPPRLLVTAGLYRWSRNPMYLGVLVMLAGWALLYRSGLHAGYAVAVGVAFQFRVVRVEEPFLARMYGEDWREYRARVPRWLWR